MKIVSTFLMCVTCFQLFGCTKNNEIEQINDAEYNSNTGITKIKITIGSSVFTATLNNNATATAFRAMLPLTINADELNGNEKFHYLAATLPTNTSRGGNIQPGDLMLYGNNCLVVFYKVFNTSYSYTRLGKIDNTAGLVAALGSGGITVKFEKQ